MVKHRSLIGLLVVVMAEFAKTFSVPFGKRKDTVAASVGGIDRVQSFLQRFLPNKEEEQKPVETSHVHLVVYPTQLRSHQFQTSHEHRTQQISSLYGLHSVSRIVETIDGISSGIDGPEDQLEFSYDAEKSIKDGKENLCVIAASESIVPFKLTNRKMVKHVPAESDTIVASDTISQEWIPTVTVLENWSDKCHRNPMTLQEFYDSVAPEADSKPLTGPEAKYLPARPKHYMIKAVDDLRAVTEVILPASSPAFVDMVSISKASSINCTLCTTEPSRQQYPPLQVNEQRNHVDLSYIALFCFLVGVMSTYLSGKAVTKFCTWYANRMPRFIAQLEKQAIKLLNTGQYEQVKAILRKELPRIAQYRGALHVDTAAFRHFLGKALLALEECGAAEEQLGLVVEAYEVFGEDLYMAHALEDLALAQQCLSAPVDIDHSAYEEHMQKNGVALLTMQRALRIFTEDALAAEIITPSSRYAPSTPRTSSSPLSSSDNSAMSKRSTRSNSSAGSDGSGTTSASHSTGNSHSGLSTTSSTSMNDLGAVRRSPASRPAKANTTLKQGALLAGSAKVNNGPVCTPQKPSFHNDVHCGGDTSSVNGDDILQCVSGSTDTTIGDGLNLSKISEGSGDREGEDDGLGSPFCDRRGSYGKMSYDELFSPMVSPAVPSVANPMLSTSKPARANNSISCAPSPMPAFNADMQMLSPMVPPAVPSSANHEAPEAPVAHGEAEPAEPVERDHALRDALEDLERLLMQPSASTSVLLGANTSLCLDGSSYASPAHHSASLAAPRTFGTYSACKSTSKSAAKYIRTPAKERLEYSYCSEVNYSCTPAGGNIASLLRPVLDCPRSVHVARVQHRVAQLLQALDRPEEALDYLYASRDIYLALNNGDAESVLVQDIQREITELRQQLCLPGDASLIFSPACGSEQADKSESWEEIVVFSSPQKATYHNLDASFMTAVNEMS